MNTVSPILVLALASLLPWAACAEPTAPDAPAAARVLVAELRCEANALEHVAPAPREVGFDEGLALACKLGENTYIYMEDRGSGVCVWYGCVYQRDAAGAWALQSYLSFNSVRFPHSVRLDADTLTVADEEGAPIYARQLSSGKELFHRM